MCSFYCLDFVSEMLDGRNHLSQALESLQREALCCEAKLGVTPGSATSRKAQGKSLPPFRKWASHGVHLNKQKTEA